MSRFTHIGRYDSSPMLPIHANSTDLCQRYGHVPPIAKGEPKPWHVAMVVWWRFLKRRGLAS